jgi:hypothetical protein
MEQLLSGKNPDVPSGVQEITYFKEAEKAKPEKAEKKAKQKKLEF